MNDTQIFGGWWQVDRTNELESEVLKRLVDLWRDRHEDGRLPSRQDFDMPLADDGVTVDMILRALEFATRPTV